MSLSKCFSVVRTGTYLGECFIYCHETVVITREIYRYSLTSNVQDPKNPDIIEETPNTSEDWERLLSLIDMDTFRGLPAIIGQPDRADAGGEWIEITCSGISKRVDFEMNAFVTGIDALVKHLRSIRAQLAKKARRTALPS